MELPREIKPGDVLEYARRYMRPEEIDHHASDLYLKVTPVSKEIVSRLTNKALLETFHSQIEPFGPWYDLAFCYHES